MEIHMWACAGVVIEVMQMKVRRGKIKVLSTPRRGIFIRTDPSVRMNGCHHMAERTGHPLPFSTELDFAYCQESAPSASYWCP